MNLFIVCCNDSDTKDTTETLLENNEGNVFFYVSNQSFDIDPVDIQINIDDKVAINQDFYVEGQHNWIEFIYLLSPGTHKLSITSIKGEATFEEEFEIVDNHWIVIDFWYYPNSFSIDEHFTFLISDEPVGFD